MFDTPETAFEFAVDAACGDLGALRQAREKNPPCPWDERASYYAARAGQLGTLQWLRAQDPPCPWDAKRCKEAAELRGHADVASWIEAYEAPEDLKEPEGR